MKPEEISKLVEEELRRIGDADVKEQIRALVVTPRVEERPWDYGPEGQTFPCWIVLEHEESNTGIAYSAHGFGPKCPWGLLWLSGESLSMGMDSSWYPDLESAFRDSFAFDEEA